MKLKDEFIRLPKDMVYEMYLKIVYDNKDYDDITRGKMLDAILNEYKQENFLYSICTQKELEFLMEMQKRKFKKEDLEKYAWEIEVLNDKGIFSRTTMEVFEDQQKNVLDAIELYKQNPKNKERMDEIIVYMISTIKINAQLLTKAFFTMIESLFGISEENVNRLLGNPLFHFYCEFTYRYVDIFDREEEFINYREYWDLLDDLDIARKEFGMGGTKTFDIRDYYDTFYYGFPIRNEKVKKMVDKLQYNPLKKFLYGVIDEARVLNFRENLAIFFDEEELEIVNDALDEMPCAAMNGFTPNDYKKEQMKTMDLSSQLTIIPQNNAHLCKSAADLYYKLYFGVLDYTNKKYQICPELKKIYNQEGLNVHDLMKVDDFLWEHKEIIDDFVEENPNKFNAEELEIVEGFKNAITSDRFIIVGFEREYTEILSEDGKMYMVKGIRADFDELISPCELPKMIKTTLLMFQGKLVFNSFFSHLDINMGNDLLAFVIENQKKAIRYYHL